MCAPVRIGRYFNAEEVSVEFEVVNQLRAQRGELFRE
jgi:hypothetical protein